VVALTEEGDILDFSIDEAGLTQAILKCGRRSFVVADHSKFGRPAIVKVAHLDQVDTLFTDSLPAKNWSNLAEIVRLRVAE
jgi:DeoR family glycerol-3-phosphate regulon repressor